jgi:hypothetical protein
MASPPPPYANITGITRTVMKDNAQETLPNYNGNARPGEMTVDQTTSNVYIGNATGNLTLVWSPAVTQFTVYTSAETANITGQVGQVVAVSDTGGRLAFWDSANTRWSFVYDNSAV